jgi:hypothetical protein
MAYKQPDIDRLGAEGLAHKAKDGHFHFPVKTVEDVKNAIRALGRAPADERASIRRFVMKRASALGVSASDVIPESWQSDGTLKEAHARVSALERRDLGASNCAKAPTALFTSKASPRPSKCHTRSAGE